jgi:hypothetical protein
MNRLGLAVLLALTAPPVFAEVDLPPMETAATRYGEVRIADTDLDGFQGRQLMFRGAPVPGIADMRVHIRSVLPAPGGSEADLVLISLDNGGNGCPVTWALVEVTQAGMAGVDSFGTCSETILDLRTAGATLIIDIASFDPAVERARVIWQNGEIAMQEIGHSNDGASAAGPGPDVTRWTGRHPAEPFQDAGERLRFGAHLSQDQVFELARRVTVAGEVTEADGFVIGQGFDPASGGDIAGMWGIRIADGAPFAIFRGAGDGPQLFGLPESELPEVASAYLAGEPE